MVAALDVPAVPRRPRMVGFRGHARGGSRPFAAQGRPLGRRLHPSFGGRGHPGPADQRRPRRGRHVQGAQGLGGSRALGQCRRRHDRHERLSRARCGVPRAHGGIEWRLPGDPAPHRRHGCLRARPVGGVRDASQGRAHPRPATRPRGVRDRPAAPVGEEAAPRGAAARHRCGQRADSRALRVPHAKRARARSRPAPCIAARHRARVPGQRARPLLPPQRVLSPRPAPRHAAPRGPAADGGRHPGESVSRPCRDVRSPRLGLYPPRHGGFRPKRAPAKEGGARRGSGSRPVRAPPAAGVRGAVFPARREGSRVGRAPRVRQGAGRTCQDAALRARLRCARAPAAARCRARRLRRSAGAHDGADGRGTRLDGAWPGS